MIKTVRIGSNYIIVVPKTIHSTKLAISKCSEGMSDKVKGEGAKISDLLSVQPDIIALINGGYFYYNKMDSIYPGKRPSICDVGDPVGIAKIRTHVFPTPPRRLRNVTCFTNRFGFLVQKRKGDPFELLLECELPREPLNKFKYLLTCSPVLIRNGEPTKIDTICDKKELSSEKGEAGNLCHLVKPNYRSVIATRENGSILLISFGGKVTFSEMQEFLIKIGTLRAFNLDGGGSTCLWTLDSGMLVVSEAHRVIGNAIVIFQ